MNHHASEGGGGVFQDRERGMGQELRIYRELEKLKEFVVRLELKG